MNGNGCVCMVPMCAYAGVCKGYPERDVIYNHVASRWGVKRVLRRDDYILLQTLSFKKKTTVKWHLKLNSIDSEEYYH